VIAGEDDRPYSFTRDRPPPIGGVIERFLGSIRLVRCAEESDPAAVVVKAGEVSQALSSIRRDGVYGLVLTTLAQK
jgi:hypothetical protein